MTTRIAGHGDPGVAVHELAASISRALPVPEYRGLYTVKQITTGGTLRFANRVLYLANALTGKLVETDEVDDGVWRIFFHTLLIATLDERDYFIKE